MRIPFSFGYGLSFSAISIMPSSAVRLFIEKNNNLVLIHFSKVVWNSRIAVDIGREKTESEKE